MGVPLPEVRQVMHRRTSVFSVVVLICGIPSPESLAWCLCCYFYGTMPGTFLFSQVFLHLIYVVFTQIFNFQSSGSHSAFFLLCLSSTAVGTQDSLHKRKYKTIFKKTQKTCSNQIPKIPVSDTQIDKNINYRNIKMQQHKTENNNKR